MVLLGISIKFVFIGQALQGREAVACAA